MGISTATYLAFSTATPSSSSLSSSSSFLPSPPLPFILGRSNGPRYPSLFRPKQQQSASSSLFNDDLHLLPRSRTALKASSSSNNNKTKPPPLPKTEDPFLLLGLDSRNPTTDPKDIKRAYRKRAMQYHPDVICNPDSTSQERDEASKDFARINAAYEMLTGGAKGGAGAGSSSATGGAKSSSGYNYQPPHRRTSGYSSSSGSSYGKSTNWEDFMPKYDEEDAKYDADGDSFSSIFSDLVTGAAGYAAGASGSGGGGIFGDFIDFLEGNIDGFESGYDDDKSLSQLLMYGSFDEVASEMDETDILVTSLETKLSTVENELMQAQADLNVATRFSEKLDIEERMAELNARERVVKDYLKKGKKRLLRLRERYKELMVDGRGGRGYGGSSSSSSGSTRSSSRSQNSSGQNGSYSSGGGSSRSSNYSSAPGPAPSASPPTTSTSSSPAPSPASSSSSSSSWRNEGFSSSYGRRSSGSRRSSRRNRGTSDADATSRTAAEQPPNQQQQQQRRASENTGSRSSSNSSSSNYSTGNTGRAGASSSTSTPQQYEPWVPPHRRTQSSAERAAQDNKRLRELKVDDDFEKLKKEMGM